MKGYRWSPCLCEVRTHFRLSAQGCTRLVRVVPVRRGRRNTRWRVLEPFRCCGRFRPPFVLVDQAGWQRWQGGLVTRAYCPRCRTQVGRLYELLDERGLPDEHFR